MRANVVKGADVAPQELGGGVSRKVLSHTPEMMVVQVIFEKGGVGAVHTHPHAQSTYVLSGAFEFTIDGEPVVVRAGDTISFAPEAVHGTVCLEAGALIDVFTPMREDFLR